MGFSLNRLTQLTPAERIEYVAQHADEIDALTERQKERVGTLLCHASPKESRRERPIIGDLRSDKAQETFDLLAPTQGIEKAQKFAELKVNGKNTERT